MIDIEDVKRWLIAKLKTRDLIVWLIAIQLALFLINMMINFIGFALSKQAIGDFVIQNYLSLSTPFEIFIFKPYSLLTYLFFHNSFFHLLSNAVLFFYFGSTYISLTHKKKLLPLYIYGGVFSAVVVLIIYALNESLPPAVISGSSGAVMAVIGAVCTLIPESEILIFGRFKIKYKWVVTIFIIMNLIGLNNPNSGENYIHLAGLFFGFLFLLLEKSGIDIIKPFNSLVDYLVSLLDFNNKMRVTYINDQFKKKKSYKSENSQAQKQEKIDAILDKISDKGYESLSKAEKNFLFHNSNKN